MNLGGCRLCECAQSAVLSPSASAAGCSQRAAAGSTGPAFNAQQGGTYAAEWDPRAGHVRVWSWAAGEEPQDVAGKAPRPEEPLGAVSGGGHGKVDEDG
eukprot:Skav226349  [mRNA]  locus=scaffold2980:263072:264352:- [translate_table: standard]